MTYDEIRVGSQVQLLSGGPVMTVRFTIDESDVSDDVHYEPEDTGVHCQWFDEKRLHEGIFPPMSLRPA